MKTILVALAGNPNCGKSTLFNSLTGSQQDVGNWPGKTVARKAGHYRWGDVRVEVIDLPGTYSLSAFSPEERIARDFIVSQHPDVVVNVLDASNLERNLYLTTQIMETGARLILVLNMSDVAARRGYTIAHDRLSRWFGNAPVVPTVASRGQGLKQLRETIVRVALEQDGKYPERGDRSEHDSGTSQTTSFPQLRGCH